VQQPTHLQLLRQHELVLITEIELVVIGWVAGVKVEQLAEAAGNHLDGGGRQ
jgi:hypothetical protein